MSNCVSCVIRLSFRLRVIFVLIVWNSPAYVVLRPCTSVRWLTVLGVYVIWHISNMGNADIRFALSRIFGCVMLNIWFSSMTCFINAVFSLRAIISWSVCVLLFWVSFVYWFILLLCPLMRVLS